ncbi:hypothetical protein [Rhodococcoides fascians]|uniref:hypothetical protein n=1 Tax=Rhodococcoides fascians TaxID=1828 RepID=UPI0011AA5D91|nr:hypothetical protein [Rhodococcus fascians]
MAAVFAVVVGMLTAPSAGAQPEDDISGAPQKMGQSAPLYDCLAPPNPIPDQWTCIDGGLPAPALPPEVQRSLPRELAPAAFSNYCTFDGTTCWTVDSDFNARVHASNVRFMLNTTQVGSAVVDVEWGLEGNGTFVNKFQIRPSVRTTSAFFLVSLWNGAEGVVDAGSELDFKIYSNQSSVAPGGLRSCSCASRAVLRDNDNYDHNARAEVSVSIQGQQGFWYFYVRSPVAHRDGPPAGQATIYRFRPADHLSGDSLGGDHSF